MNERPLQPRDGGLALGDGRPFLAIRRHGTGLEIAEEFFGNLSEVRLVPDVIRSGNGDLKAGTGLPHAYAGVGRLDANERSFARGSESLRVRAV